MTEFEDIPYDKRPFDGKFEAYLDGVMAADERAAFEAEIAANPQLADEVALQARIDASLEHLFPSVVTPASHVVAMERHFDSAIKNTEPATIKIRWPWLVGITSVAAAACLAFAFWNFEPQSDRAPHFEPIPLAQIYKQTVAEGFEPYYECRDDQRFADTFEQRQGIPVHLAKLPLGSTMKGLSYPGGLSRETTAMLCEADGSPVMVFVDRDAKDQPAATKNGDPELHVFREARDGLVFYEVTPLDKPTMMQHLHVGEN
jgi:hypothetical protein